MLCAKTRTHFLSPFSLSSFALKPLLHSFKPYLPSSSLPSIKMSTTSTTTTQIIEHFVLFKINPNTDPSKITAMFNGLNGLISLPQVLYLTAGPILRTRSKSLSFTHMLHSRYKSKPDLTSYGIHPDHVSVVTKSKPIIDDIMAVDWVADEFSGPICPLPGSAMRVSFMKLKEGLEEKAKSEVLRVVGGIKDKFPTIDQITFGENFSPDRAKGYSIGSIAIFPGLSELEGLDSDSELVKSEKEKVRDLLESVVVVDYVIPPSPGAAASL